MTKSAILLGAVLAVSTIMGCSIPPRGIVSASNRPTVPLVTDWSHSPLRGELLTREMLDPKLVAFAVDDAKATLGKNVSFYKALRADDGTIRYVFEIERTDDSFLVYEKNLSTKEFSRKYLHNQLHL